MFKTGDMVFYKSDTCYGECCAPILKHFPASLPRFQKPLSKLTRVFKGVSTVLETDEQDFYIINWRNTLVGRIGEIDDREGLSLGFIECYG